MDNERTVVLENISGQPIGLKDTQNRTYRFGVGAKIRISRVSLQDILDYPASKIIFNEKMVKISNIGIKELYDMGLTEDEIKKYLGDGYAAVAKKEAEKVIEPEPVEEPEPEIIPEPESEPEIEEEEKVEEPAPVKKTTAKKTTARKTTAKKTTTKRKTSSKKAA